MQQASSANSHIPQLIYLEFSGTFGLLGAERLNDMAATVSAGAVKYVEGMGPKYLVRLVGFLDFPLRTCAKIKNRQTFCSISCFNGRARLVRTNLKYF